MDLMAVAIGRRPRALPGRADGLDARAHRGLGHGGADGRERLQLKDASAAPQRIRSQWRTAHAAECGRAAESAVHSLWDVISGRSMPRAPHLAPVVRMMKIGGSRFSPGREATDR